MSESKLWTPKEVRKTINQIAGIILLLIGIYMIFNQIQADGEINLKTTLFTGSIKSASAGLICVFIGSLMISSSSLSVPVDALRSIKENRVIIIGLFFTFVIIITIISALYPDVRLIGIFIVSFLATAISKVLLTFID